MGTKNVKVAQPYANAFIDMAGSSFPLDSMISDLTTIETTSSESAEFGKTISNH